MYRERWGRFDSNEECRKLKDTLRRREAEIKRIRQLRDDDYGAKLKEKKAHEDAQKALADEEKAHKKTKQQVSQLRGKLSGTKEELKELKQQVKIFLEREREFI